MKITPLELRQYTFEKTFRGYSIEEVDMFINNLSQEWERILNESKMLRMQLEIAEKEATKLREIELTLFKTLKTAEDTSTMITEQANQQAERNLLAATNKSEKMISEAQLTAEKLVSDANMKAFEIVNNAEKRANYIKEDVLSEVKSLERDFKAMQQYKDNLMTQLRSLATATIDHVERFENKFDNEAIEEKIEKAHIEISNELKATEVEEEQEIAENESLEINDIIEETPSTSEVIDEVNTITEEEKTVEEIVEEAETQLEEPIVEEVEISPEIELSIENEPIVATKIEDTEVSETPEVIYSIEEETTKLIDKIEDEKIEEPINSFEERVEDFASVIKEESESQTESPTIDEPFEEIETPQERASFFDKIEAIKESVAKSRKEEDYFETEAPKVAVIASSINSMVYEDEKPQIQVPKGDELELIEGIGPKIKELLNTNNISTFRDLAITPVYRIRQYLDDAGSHFNMVDPSTWTEQALLAAEGRWEELRERQAYLVGGKEIEKVEEAPSPVQQTLPIEEVSIPKPVSNLDDITEEMLEKVNKVKNAIRKAMTDKSDVGITKEDGYIPTLNDVLNKNRKSSGGSFFDNVQ